MRITGICVLAISAAGLLAADESPFIGKWKLDPSKSDFTGTTFKYEDAGGGKTRLSFGNDSYTFTTDGKEHPGLYGQMVSCKQIDPNTREMTFRLKGKLLSTDTIRLSDDEKTMTETYKGTRPDGSSFEETDVSERQGEGSGFMGTWRTKDVKGAEELTEIQPNGEDGLTLILPQMKAKCAAKLDGREYPATGPEMPPGLTLTLTKTGDRSLELVEKVKGKPEWKGSWAVSDDGLMLTVTGASAGTTEQTKSVYNKQ